MTAERRRKFYGRRQGHKLHARQAQVFVERMPRLAIDDVVPQKLFADQADIARYGLEIGFGGGEHLLAHARENPTIGYIGSEVFLNGVAKLVSGLDPDHSANIRLYHGDARDLIEAMPDACLDFIYLLYPDPWPKKRHHKRRFINPENLHHLSRILRAGGLFYFATDIPDYVNWGLCHIRQHGGFDWVAEKALDWKTPYPAWPGTRYEAKALAAGRVPTYLTFERRS